MTQEKQDYSLTTFSEVVIEKEKLVSKLKENRENHNAIYEAAIVGYWVKAKEVVAEKVAQFEKVVVEYTDNFKFQHGKIAVAVEGKDLNGIGSISVGWNFNSNWPLVYPVNHLEDYDRVISMLELSIADKVQLSAQDFDAYVRNNWSWKKTFSASNQGYVCAVTGAYILASSGGFMNTKAYAFAVSGYSAL